MRERIFKTAWFAKAAAKARIDDFELCTAIGQVMTGQADDLGGGVFKKRLSKKCLAFNNFGKRWELLGLCFFVCQERSSEYHNG